MKGMKCKWISLFYEKYKKTTIKKIPAFAKKMRKRLLQTTQGHWPGPEQQQDSIFLETEIE
jgi:hypothetical protein